MTREEAFERLASKEFRRSEVQKMALDERSRIPASGGILTISRDHHCGAEEIARSIASELGWDLYDRGIVDRIAEDRCVSVGVLERLDEYSLGYLEEWSNQFFLPHYVGQVSYLRGLAHVLLEIARKGRAVIVGRGANFLLPERNRLAVRLTAPLSWRVAFYAAEFGVAERDARRAIEEEDRRRRGFVEHSFHKDPTAPLHYDLVINTRTISPDAASALILDALRARFGRLAVRV